MEILSKLGALFYYQSSLLPRQNNSLIWARDVPITSHISTSCIIVHSSLPVTSFLLLFLGNQTLSCTLEWKKSCVLCLINKLNYHLFAGMKNEDHRFFHQKYLAASDKHWVCLGLCLCLPVTFCLDLQYFAFLSTALLQVNGNSIAILKGKYRHRVPMV